MDDAAFAIGAHQRHEAAGEIVPAENIGLELFCQKLARDVFHGTGLAVSAIVEQRIKLAVAGFRDIFDQFLNGFGLGVIEIESLKPLAF